MTQVKLLLHNQYPRTEKKKQKDWEEKKNKKGFALVINMDGGERKRKDQARGNVDFLRKANTIKPCLIITG